MGTDLTVGSIPRHLVAFATPMLIGGMFQILYSFINIFWVGKRLGRDAVAIIAQAMPINAAFTSVAIGLTLASTILVSHAYGRKDYDQVKEIARTSLALNLIASLIGLIAVSVAAEPFMRAMQTPAGILHDAVHYLRILMWTLPCVFVMFMASAVLRGVGDSLTPLYFQILSLIMTAILDPLLIFGWLGFPRLGLNGTAYSNITAQAIGIIAISIYLDRKRHIGRLYWNSMSLNWQTCKRLLALGIPSMLQNAMVSLASVFLTGLVNTFGEAADAAFGVGTRWDQISFVPATTMQAAIAGLAGQNIGAGRFDRVREIFIWGITITCAMSMVGAVLALSIPGFIMKLFASDPSVIRIGIGYLRIVGLTYVLYAIMFAANGIINGAGHTLATTSFTLLTLWIIRIPLATFLSHKTGHIESIWYSMLTSVSVSAVASLAYYLLGFWKKPVGHRRTAEARE